MSIASEISRLSTIRDGLRSKLISLGIISSSTAKLNDCSTAINNIASKSSSDLTTSGASVTVPVGYYSANASKSVSSGSCTIATPTVSASGLITSSASISAGYISSNPSSKTKQLTTKGATTYTPSTSNQTIAAGTYLTGTITVSGSSNLVAGNIKKGVTIFGVTGTYE